MRTRTKVLLALGIPICAVFGIFAAASHRSKPYFVEVPVASLKGWEDEQYFPSGEGSGWALKRYNEPMSAMNHDIDHWIWICNGKAFDLRNTEDKWGFGNSKSWDFDLIGSKLYVYDAHERLMESPGVGVVKEFDLANCPK